MVVMLFIAFAFGVNSILHESNRVKRARAEQVERDYAAVVEMIRETP